MSAAFGMLGRAALDTRSLSVVTAVRVVVDIPTRQIAEPFDYALEALEGVEVGSCVLVDFGNRPVVGYVVETDVESTYEKLKPVRALLGGPFFDKAAVETADWIARWYGAPISEALKLFTPPGGTPRAVKVATEGGETWVLKNASVGPVDDRWALLSEGGREFVPKGGATMQRAVLDALSAGPVRVAELTADLGSVDSALRRLSELGAVEVEHRRRVREGSMRERPAPRHERLSSGQTAALQAIGLAVDDRTGVVLLDGVTGSGKTEVYLRAIERVLESGGSAIVLVPEISLTPQTVGRFRSRFGDEVAVLHSRLSAGERYDQWDRVRAGEARVVVGARSALFCPAPNLRLVVIDEEHESSYKQGQAPRYHARDVASRLAQAAGAAVVLGSGTPSLESLARCEAGEWVRVELPERVAGGEMPPVQVVDMAAEFATGHRSMFSRPLLEALEEVGRRKEKAVLLLNRRGFASFLLCRECGHVPTCDSCSTSLTYHEVGSRLACHHCDARRPVPPVCPECGSPYLRQFGAGTQRVEAELAAVAPGLPVVRMDADTTTGKGGHERALAAFEALESGILLGTQMIAKGLDYPEVTLVGVVNADTTLHLPDFRAAERTWQLLEQVAGRAGRGKKGGRVIIQTYWPDHPAIQAVAAHDAAKFYEREAADRRELGYPPYGALANVIVRAGDNRSAADVATAVARELESRIPAEWRVVGPAPAPIARVKGVFRWHVLVKGPASAQLAPFVTAAMAAVTLPRGAQIAVDIDPTDLL